MKTILQKTTILFLFLISANLLFPKKPIAKFKVNVNCRTVMLQDSSTGNIDIYSWDYGDGITYNSSNKNATHTYNSNGQYNIRLIILDSAAGILRDTISKQVFINCNTCNIYADFSTKKDLLINEKMIFTNKTSGQSTYTSAWSFGYIGNGGSTLKNPTHTFPSYGYFNIKLVSSYFDSAMAKTCKDSIIRKIAIHKLRANFGYIIDAVKCGKVTFSDSSKGYPNLVTWQFADYDSYFTFDTNSTYGKNPVMNYPVADSTQIFNVTYIIKYIDSSTSSYYYDTMRKQITIPACNKCMIKAIINLQGDSTKAFTGTLYNLSTGTINMHFWNFGDGGTSTVNAPVHSYTNAGTYTLIYIARDTVKNCSDTARVTFTIDSSGFIKRQVFVLRVIDKTSTRVESVNYNDLSKLKIYPNPANGLINIEMDRTHNLSVMKLINSIGQIVYNGPTQSIFDMGKYPSGNYALLFIGDEVKFVVKIIRE